VGVKPRFLSLTRVLNHFKRIWNYTNRSFMSKPIPKNSLTFLKDKHKKAIPEIISLLLNELYNSVKVHQSPEIHWHFFYSSLVTCHIIRMIRHVSRDSNKCCRMLATKLALRLAPAPQSWETARPVFAPGTKQSRKLWFMLTEHHFSRKWIENFLTHRDINLESGELGKPDKFQWLMFTEILNIANSGEMCVWNKRQYPY
jgi:hypothetical protein